MTPAVLFGLLGLIVGSFLNVVIVRRGARSLGGRSGCMACGRTLQWFEMLPVFSWIALRGRCRSCRAHISVQYPLVEAATALLFVLIMLAPIGSFEKIIGLCIMSLLIVIAVYDIRHTIIPDEWVWAFNVLALLSALVSAFLSASPYWLSAILAGPLAAFPLFALWAASRGAWMGLGDPKLALGMGWLLGIQLGVYAVFFAFVIGAVVSVLVLLPFGYLRQAYGITRLGASTPRLTMKSEVPFGPFLVAACLLMWFAAMYGLQLPFII